MEYIIVQKNGNIYVSLIEAEKKKNTEPKAFKYKEIQQYIWDDKKYKYHATLALLFLLSFLFTLLIVRDIIKSFIIWIVFTTIGVFVSRHLD